MIPWVAYSASLADWTLAYWFGGRMTGQDSESMSWISMSCPCPRIEGGNSQARFLGCRDAADVRKCTSYQLKPLNWRMEIGSGCWCNLILCPQLPSTVFAACSSFIHFHPVSSFLDCQATGFGGWPWPSDSLAHDRHRQRFAQYADGRVDERPMPEA